MPSTPAVRAPRLLRTRVQATARTAGSTTRLNRSSNRRAGSLPAHWCSLVWILSTRARAVAGSNVGAPVFPGGLLTFQFLHCELAAALGHVTGFPGLGLLRWLRPTTRRSADGAPSPPRPGRSGIGTAPRWFPRSPLDRSTGIGAQLFPGGLATTTPQHFIVAFDPANPGPGRSSLGDCSSRPRCAPLTGPDPPGSSRRSTVGGSTTGSCIRTPVRLACQARAVWQYRPVLSLSGLLPPPSAPPEIDCPPASSGRCDDPKRKDSHLPAVMRRLVAHRIGRPDLAPVGLGKSAKAAQLRTKGHRIEVLTEADLIDLI